MSANLLSVRRTERNTIELIPPLSPDPALRSVWQLDIDSAALQRDGGEIEDGLREWLSSEIDITWLERLHDGWLDAHRYVRPAEPQPEALEDWNDGRMLFHHHVCPGGRTDLYEVDGVRYRADESICPDPDCICDEVHVAFLPEQGNDVAGPPIGTATLHVPDLAMLKLTDGADRPTIERLVAALRIRHRDGRVLAEHIASVKRFGHRLRTQRAAAATVTPRIARKPVGRNEPCPCGSGRKYKRCCGKS